MTKQFELQFEPKCTRDRPLRGFEALEPEEILQRILKQERLTLPELLARRHPDAVVLYATGCYDTIDEHMICPWCRLEWDRVVSSEL